MRDRQPEYERGFAAQREAERLFKSDKHEDALPLYRAAAQFFRNALPVNWVRVFFCEATGVRCLEAIAADYPSRVSEYQAELHEFLSRWPPAEVRSRLRPEQRVEEALANRAWRESSGQGAESVALAVQHAMAGDFDSARAVLDARLRSLEREAWLPSWQTVKRILQSKRLVLDVFEEQQKPESQQDLKRITTAYTAAARACRLEAPATGVLEEMLRAFRCFYLSHLAKWAAFADLRALDRGSREVAIGLRRASTRLERAVRLADAAATPSREGAFPRFHARYLSLWRFIVRMREALVRFMETGATSAFDEARTAWEGAVRDARLLCQDGREGRFFPNRFYSLDDLENEGRWLNGLKAFQEENWETCHKEFSRWNDEFPEKHRETWRHRQGRVRLAFVRALLRCVRGETGVDRELLDEISTLGQTRFHRGIGRAAEQLLGYASLWAKSPASKDTAIATAKESARLQILDARIGGEPGDQSSSRIVGLAREVALPLLQPLARMPREIPAWRKWYFAACANLLGYLGDYYQQLGVLAGREDLETLTWMLPNGSGGTVRGPRWVVKQVQRFCEEPSLQVLWSGQDTDLESAYATVHRRLEETARMAPVVVSASGVERVADVETATATPHWNAPEETIELVRMSSGGEPIVAGTYYLPPEYGTGCVKTHYRVRPASPLIPVSYRCNWEAAMDNTQRLDFSTLFRHLAAGRLAQIVQGDVEEEKTFVQKDGASVDVDVVISREGRVIVVAESTVSFSGSLSNPYKVQQMVNAQKAVMTNQDDFPVGIVLTNAEEVSGILEKARKEHIRVWKVILRPTFNKCVQDPRRMQVVGFVELFPCSEVDVRQIDLHAWPAT